MVWWFPQKILSRKTDFKIDHKKEYFLSTNLSWFLKDHVTLKTEVMAAVNSALPLVYILNYILNIYKQKTFILSYFLCFY